MTDLAKSVSVTMYNVGFGDCFLLTFDTDERPHTMLIDCGRLQGSLGDGPDFWDVVRHLVDTLPTLGGQPHIDVLVMTHRHRDHVHGFSNPALWNEVSVGEVWMPWTENPNDPAAKRLSQAQETAATSSFRALRAFGVNGGPATELAINSMANQAAMETLFRLGRERIRFLPEATALRSTRLDAMSTSGALPEGVVVHVLGPSRDPKVIARLNPPKGESFLRLGAVSVDTEALSETDRAAVPMPWGGQWDIKLDRWHQTLGNHLARSEEEMGGANGAREPLADYIRNILDDAPNLMDHVRTAARSDAEALAFNVDNSLNGTSLVLLIEACGESLLFPGDAQWGTWQMILETPEWQDKLRRTTFLKVGHHGSHNATPRGFVEGDYLHGVTAMVSVALTTNTAAGWKAIPKLELVDALTDPAEGRVTKFIYSNEDVVKAMEGERNGESQGGAELVRSATGSPGRGRLVVDQFSKTVVYSPDPTSSPRRARRR